MASNDWWNSMRTGPPPPSSMSCSGNLNRSSSEMIKVSSSCEEMAASDSSSTVQIPPGFDWNQVLLREDMNSRRLFRTNEPNQTFEEEMNQAFLIDQPQLSSEECGVSAYPPMVSSIPFGFSSHMLQGLPSSYDAQSISNSSSQMAYVSSSWPNLQLKQQEQEQQQNQPGNQFYFSNNTPYWNASGASIAANEIRSSSTTAQFLGRNNSESKPNSDGLRDSSTSSKKSSGEPTFKKPRIETPSSLPAFKVRKEKLGDRITALQQLVSPFGKTDTASVLHEAIEYIKFLHDQVNNLSTPYMKSGPPMQHHHQRSERPKDEEGPKRDLRSRGLCLVPISSTFAVTSETTADFWTPNFGGTYK
ncbi:hypothetical protein QJS10_CPA01g01067 [Acorus calamus]|uniref:BHLH domain-containing protein n=1 Tax=Acorus calamus TaxID=4465 RepID=A0AAV9FIC2_ACOCL|nr:hypothetical protein QJS10_CPA01g01067 [Acorus calamus]